MKKLLMILFASVLFFTGCASTSSDKANWNDISLKDVNGNDAKISDYKGKPTVIKIWASWCSICLSGLKHYNELSAMDIDANIISIVEPDRNGEMNKEDFTEWFLSLDDYKNITVLLDTEGIAKSEFAIRAYPTMIYLNEAGEIIKNMPGHQTNEQIIETLESIQRE